MRKISSCRVWRADLNTDISKGKTYCQINIFFSIFCLLEEVWIVKETWFIFRCLFFLFMRDSSCCYNKCKLPSLNKKANKFPYNLFSDYSYSKYFKYFTWWNMMFVKYRCTGNYWSFSGIIKKGYLDILYFTCSPPCLFFKMADFRLR